MGILDWDASNAEEDADDDIFVPFDEPTKDLNDILQTIGGAHQEQGYFVIQALQLHIARHVPRSLRSLRSGMRWSEPVTQYWNQTIRIICESSSHICGAPCCVGALFSKLCFKQARPQTRLEVADIVHEIKREETVWSSLINDPDFLHLVRILVRSFDTVYWNKTPHCTCHIKKLNG